MLDPWDWWSWSWLDYLTSSDQSVLTVVKWSLNVIRNKQSIVISSVIMWHFPTLRLAAQVQGSWLKSSISCSLPFSGSASDKGLPERLQVHPPACSERKLCDARADEEGLHARGVSRACRPRASSHTWDWPQLWLHMRLLRWDGRAVCGHLVPHGSCQVQLRLLVPLQLERGENYDTFRI